MIIEAVKRGTVPQLLARSRIRPASELMPSRTKHASLACLHCALVAVLCFRPLECACAWDDLKICARNSWRVRQKENSIVDSRRLHDENHAVSSVANSEISLLAPPTSLFLL